MTAMHPSVSDPDDEILRLEELQTLDILDTQREERFDRYTRLVAEILEVPAVSLSLVDECRQWFKSRVGIEAQETPREASFCTYAIRQEYLEVTDARHDVFFKNHPAVVDAPFIRFYAGTVLRGPTGQPIGTLCVCDQQPRALSSRQRSWLIALGRLVEEEINHRNALSRARRDIEANTLRDAVTGLPGEILLGSTLADLLRVAEAEARHLAVIHLRLDNLDAIGRVHGRHTRNQVLQQLADRLTAPGTRILAAGRVGASRFTLVAPLTSPRSAFDTALPVVDMLGEPMELAGHPVRAEIDAGVSVFPVDGTDPQELQERARIALRDHEPHRRIHLFSREGEKHAIRRHRIAQRLEAALAEERLTLHFQPLFRASGSGILGFEALARWQDEQLGTIGPGEFIPIAERNDRLSRLLTRWVLREGCRQARRWQVGAPIRLGINIPAREFYQDDFVDLVLGTAAQSGLEPGLLTLELTEESLVTDVDRAVRTMGDLAAHGVRLALDDFGTGYSSLSHLRRLPVDILKIDKSFIDDLPGDGAAEALAKGILSIAHGLDLLVVAEGVEHESQRQLLEALGCDVIQGFLLGRPMSAEHARAAVAGNGSALSQA